MGDNIGRTRTFAGTPHQAPLRRNTAQSRPPDVHSSGPTAPRMQTSRSTSSMTTLQHYPSSSFSFLNPSNNYSAYYIPPSLSTYQTTSSSNQGPITYSAGSHSMQATRSLGGMTSSSNINPPFPMPMPSYGMGQLQNLPPQALAHSLVESADHFVGQGNQRSSAQGFAPSGAPQSSDEDNLCVSPKLIMDPLAGPSAGQLEFRDSRRSSDSSSTAFKFPSAARRQSSQSQSQPFTSTSASGVYSTNSSPLANRNLDVTLSPALLSYKSDWELPSSLATLPRNTGASSRPSSSASSLSTNASLSNLQIQGSYSSNFGTNQVLSNEPPNLPYMLTANDSNHMFIPDSGYNTQGKSSPLTGQTEPIFSKTSNFRYSGYEPGGALPSLYDNASGYDRTIYNTSSSSDNARPSSEPLSGFIPTPSMGQDLPNSYSTYPGDDLAGVSTLHAPSDARFVDCVPSRRRSYNNLRSSTYPVGYSRPTSSSNSSSVGSKPLLNQNPRPYSTRTRQNMQGLVHSDHVDQGFPGEWGGAFR